MRRFSTTLAPLTAGSLIFFSACSATAAAPPPQVAAVTHTLSIPSQSLGEALKALSAAANEQLLFSEPLVAGKQSTAIAGEYTTDQALNLLLQGSGLQADRTRSGVLLIRESSSRGSATTLQSSEAMGDDITPEEIIVTATKRPEAVDKIAGSVTALSGNSLEAAGDSSYSDYLAKVPGVVLNNSIPGYSTVIIRGIATTAGFDQGQGTTGFYVNDIPLTDPSLSLGNPDIDTFDVQDVAVLRGPQGSLYGASALGGAINYQATPPDVSDYEFAARGTIATTEDGGTSNATKVLANVPLIDDRLAIRGVYLNREDAGYIDNVGTGDRDSNKTQTEGGRALVRWKPSDTTIVDYLFLRQTQNTHDRGFQEPLLVGPLQKLSVIPEYAELTTEIHSLRFDQVTPIGTVTALASLVEKDIDQILDFTASALAARFGRLINPLAINLTGGDEGKRRAIA